MTEFKINASGLGYHSLNKLIKEYSTDGPNSIKIENVFGQRYIGAGLESKVRIEISGTPGNDLGAFMSGPDITVYGNAQDGCGNTMDGGRIVVYGGAGDTIALAARGGQLFVRDGVGYRAGIHMKGDTTKSPALVIGGSAQDFLGEYLAGGVIVVLGLSHDGQRRHRGRFIGTGMHGGVIYISGELEEHQIAGDAVASKAEEADLVTLEPLLTSFAGFFGYEKEELLSNHYLKLLPRYLRPYARLYAPGGHETAPDR